MAGPAALGLACPTASPSLDAGARRRAGAGTWWHSATAPRECTCMGERGWGGAVGGGGCFRTKFGANSQQRCCQPPLRLNPTPMLPCRHSVSGPGGVEVQGTCLLLDKTASILVSLPQPGVLSGYKQVLPSRLSPPRDFVPPIPCTRPPPPNNSTFVKVPSQPVPVRPGSHIAAILLLLRRACGTASQPVWAVPPAAAAVQQGRGGALLPACLQFCVPLHAPAQRPCPLASPARACRRPAPGPPRPGRIC